MMGALVCRVGPETEVWSKPAAIVFGSELVSFSLYIIVSVGPLNLTWYIIILVSLLYF